jgi:hypothetical protein
LVAPRIYRAIVLVLLILFCSWIRP